MYKIQYSDNQTLERQNEYGWLQERWELIEIDEMEDGFGNREEVVIYTARPRVANGVVDTTNPPMQCSDCGGTGKITRTKRDGTGKARPRKCHPCDGTGFL